MLFFVANLLPTNLGWFQVGTTKGLRERVTGSRNQAGWPLCTRYAWAVAAPETSPVAVVSPLLSPQIPFPTFDNFPLDTPLPDILDPLPLPSPLFSSSPGVFASRPGTAAGPAAAATLQPQTWLTRPDFALILLAEIAYENDEDFRPHLPLLFHTALMLLDSPEPLVLSHAQQLLVNLLYTLAGRHLELYDARDQNEGEYKQQVGGATTSAGDSVLQAAFVLREQSNWSCV